MLLPRQRKMRLSLLLLYPVAQIFLICRHARTVFCDAPGWTMDIDSEVQGGNIHRVESLRQCRAAICVCVVRVKLQYEMRKPRKVVVCAGWVYLEPVRVFWSNPCPFCAGAAAADFLSVRNTQYSFTDM
jgi:hypothetical protein